MLQLMCPVSQGSPPNRIGSALISCEGQLHLVRMIRLQPKTGLETPRHGSGQSNVAFLAVGNTLTPCAT